MSHLSDKGRHSLTLENIIRANLGGVSDNLIALMEEVFATLEKMLSS